MSEKRYEEYFDYKEEELREVLDDVDVLSMKNFLRLEFSEQMLEKLEEQRENEEIPEDEFYMDAVIKVVKQNIWDNILNNIENGPKEIKESMDDEKYLEDPEAYFKELDDLQKKHLKKMSSFY